MNNVILLKESSIEIGFQNYTVFKYLTFFFLNDHANIFKNFLNKQI